MDCIFCRIAKHKAEAKILYEDDEVIAFLDINPLNPGHALVIPKEHRKDIFGIEDELLAKVVRIAKKLALKMREVYEGGVNLLHASGEEAEQAVPHFHLHVVPRTREDGLRVNEWWKLKIKKLSSEQMEEIRVKLKLY
jgi:histidine triad (HIT) family protein